MRVIDLRSDTVTRPTEAMREAMARAEVGDDVYGEDPTVRRLEEEAARRMGKETAVFVPSGTMANQLAIRVHTRPGEAVLAGAGAHVLRFEAGAAAALAGVQIHALGAEVAFGEAELRDAFTPPGLHNAPTTLVALENTRNAAGGRVFPQDAAERIAGAARELGMALHLDGARIFDAAVAAGRPASELATPFDTVAFCLSKGLGAPVGSLLCGPAALRERILWLRKQQGGGMRQAGILAAAGLHALEHHVERLAEDHARARRLHRGLLEQGFACGPAPETNMVLFRVPRMGPFLAAARERGVLLGPIDREHLRAVTHLDVDDEDIEEAIRRLGAVRRELG